MAAGETFKGSPDKPESKDSGSGDKKDGKRTTPVRVPLGLSAETPAPKPESQAPTRLFDIIAEQQLHEQMKRHEADSDAITSGKKKSKKDKKKGTAEQGESTEPSESAQSEAEQPSEAIELSETPDTDTEPLKEDGEDKPVSEGAVEIALNDDTEEEIALSDRVKEWNRSRSQSPPTAVMSEVGQPTVAAEEAPVPETEGIEVPADVVEQAKTSTPAAAIEIVPAVAPEAAPEIEKEDEAPMVVSPALEWQSQPHLQHQAEMRQTESSPEEELAPTSTSEADTESPQPFKPETAAYADEALTPPHNPLFTQQGIDPALMHQRAAEAPTAPATVERVVHHRPSDFWPGVFVGGAVEHFRHKRRERKMEKSQKLQQSRIAQLEYTQRRTALEQQTAATEHLRAEDGGRYEKPAAPTEVYPMPFVAGRGPEQLKAEQQPKQLQPEQPELAEEVKPLEGHHIEKSAWHKIEVDDRTGHVAENSNIVYGEAFQRERRPEQVAALQAQQQAEAEEQERTALNPIGVPTLPRPQAQAGSDKPVPTKSPVQPTRPASPLQRRKTLRPAFAAQSGADMALWGGLVLVVLAIIAALAL